MSGLKNATAKAVVFPFHLIIYLGEKKAASRRDAGPAFLVKNEIRAWKKKSRIVVTTITDTFVALDDSSDSYFEDNGLLVFGSLEFSYDKQNEDLEDLLSTLLEKIPKATIWVGIGKSLILYNKQEDII